MNLGKKKNPTVPPFIPFYSGQKFCHEGQVGLAKQRDLNFSVKPITCGEMKEEAHMVSEFVKLAFFKITLFVKKKKKNLR